MYQIPVKRERKKNHLKIAAENSNWMPTSLSHQTRVPTTSVWLHFSIHIFSLSIERIVMEYIANDFSGIAIQMNLHVNDKSIMIVTPECRIDVACLCQCDAVLLQLKLQIQFSLVFFSIFSSFSCLSSFFIDSFVNFAQWIFYSQCRRWVAAIAASHLGNKHYCMLFIASLWKRPFPHSHAPMLLAVIVDESAGCS